MCKKKKITKESKRGKKVEEEQLDKSLLRESKEKRKKGKKEKKKKRVRGNGLDKPRCKCTCAFLSFTYYIPSTQFFLHFRENILVGLQRKQLDPTNFFPSPHSNQTLTKKVFLSIFSLKFSIYLISPPNKHTLTVSLVGGMKK